MTNESMVEALLSLSDSDKLSDDESDLLVLAVRVFEKKERRKAEVVECLRKALFSAGNL